MVLFSNGIKSFLSMERSIVHDNTGSSEFLSQKLHDWFISTELYKKYLKSFVEKKGMLLKTKISIITTVTLLMGFGFFMMAGKGIWIPCIILAVVWICHIVYFFVFGVKTIKEENSER